MIKLIRYANEGFFGHDYYSDDENTPKLVNEKENQIEDWVTGCFVFVEEEDPDALIMFRKDRTNEKRHELLVPDETLIWTWNAWPTFEIDGKYGHNYYRKLEGLLTWNSWIKLPALVIAERVKLVKKQLGASNYLWSEGIYECY
ncbi:hypothetical protein ACFQZE_06995 [Paenibacillus sp. GCM10027627]|uniref:hypothetical protein n=1 Tax=unclassified Paenibacillus TaxID=185978 RepID=UPI00363B55C6